MLSPLVAIADTLPVAWPSVARCRQDLRRIGFGELEVDTWADARLDVLYGLPTRLAKAVN